MADIFQMTFSNAFSWIELSEFRIQFDFEVFSSGSNWQIYSIGSDNGVTLGRWQAIIWTKDGLGWWHINVSLGFNELSAASGQTEGLNSITSVSTP